MKTVDVAVVVAVRNCESTVSRTLESVFSQTLRPKRIIVVDDGSTDGTLERVAACIAREQLPSRSEQATNIRLLERAHRGMAAARNAGLDFAAVCEWVAFLDPHDCWPSDFLQRHWEALFKKDRAVGSAADQVFVDAHERIVEKRCLATFAHNPVAWTLLNAGPVASCLVLRTETVRVLNGFSEKLSRNQDRELLMRLAERGDCLYAPGDAVRMGSRADSSDGERPEALTAGDLETWANLLERQLDHVAFDRFLTAEQRRALVFRAWYQAGREALRNGQREQALCSFRSAWRFHRWHHKLLIRFAQTWFTRAA